MVHQSVVVVDVDRVREIVRVGEEGIVLIPLVLVVGQILRLGHAGWLVIRGRIRTLLEGHEVFVFELLERIPSSLLIAV